MPLVDNEPGLKRQFCFRLERCEGFEIIQAMDCQRGLEQAADNGLDPGSVSAQLIHHP